MSYRTILVPYDGSKPSDDALDRAVELASSIKDSRIVLVYVVEEILFPLSKYSLRLPSNKTVKENLERFYAAMEKDGLEALEKKKQQCEAASVPAKVLVLRGRPAEQIMSCVEQERADLVVMGSTGLSGISKLKTLGSVSRKLSERLSCPVIIVH